MELVHVALKYEAMASDCNLHSIAAEEIVTTVWKWFEIDHHAIMNEISLQFNNKKTILLGGKIFFRFVNLEPNAI